MQHEHAEEAPSEEAILIGAQVEALERKISGRRRQAVWTIAVLVGGLLLPHGIELGHLRLERIIPSPDILELLFGAWAVTILASVVLTFTALPTLMVMLSRRRRLRNQLDQITSSRSCRPSMP